MDEMRQRKEKLSSEMKQIKIEAKENAARKDEFLEFSKQSQLFSALCQIVLMKNFRKGLSN